MPLLLGESPSQRGDRFHDFPLSGAPAKRIVELMGWHQPGIAPYWQLREHFETLNAIERYRDANPWSVARARDRWTAWLLSRPPAEQRKRLVVVCLGKRAAEAVGHSRPEYEWFEAGLLQVVRIPHTSGRNRAWNDHDTAGLVKATLLEAIARSK